MPSIIPPVPEADRCPKNPPDGGHFFKAPAVDPSPRRCRYCGAAEPAVPLTARHRMTQMIDSRERYDQWQIVAAHEALENEIRAEVLAEAIEAARGAALKVFHGTAAGETYNQGVSDAVAEITRLHADAVLAAGRQIAAAARTAQTGGESRG